MIATIDSLMRYPVKGLNGQTLKSVKLIPGHGFPGDRRFGFARPNSGFDPNDPKPLPKSKFYMLARDEILALLHADFDEQTGILSMIAQQHVDQFDITTIEGKQRASKFLQSYLSLPEDESPELYEASPHRFTDVSVISPQMMNAISIINLESVKEFSKELHLTLDPRRFRGNIHLSGLTPFSELDMIGRECTVGQVRLRLVQRTKRCPATEVNPVTGQRDVKVRQLLQERYSHTDMGVYAEVLEGGEISPDDKLCLCC